MRRWLLYTLRMIDYKIIGWRWRYERPPHPTNERTHHGST